VNFVERDDGLIGTWWSYMYLTVLHLLVPLLNLLYSTVL